MLIRPKSWERYGLKPWLEAAKKRLHHNVLAIALANKLARIAWSVLVRGRNFEASQCLAQRPPDLSRSATPETADDDVKGRLYRRGLREDEKRWRLGLPGACEHW